jgi:uncharacterized OB-fold protein
LTEVRQSNLPEELGELHPDQWTAPFWEHAREHRLVAARCTRCDAFRPMPPGSFCWECDGDEVAWIELSGRATLHSFTIVRRAVASSLEGVVPFVIAIVDLDGAPGVRLMTNIVDVEPEAVRTGMALTVVWDDLASGVTIPRFAPVGSAGSAGTT